VRYFASWGPKLFNQEVGVPQIRKRSLADFPAESQPWTIRFLTTLSLHYRRRRRLLAGQLLADVAACVTDVAREVPLTSSSRTALCVVDRYNHGSHEEGDEGKGHEGNEGHEEEGGSSRGGTGHEGHEEGDEGNEGQEVSSPSFSLVGGSVSEGRAFEGVFLNFELLTRGRPHSFPIELAQHSLAVLVRGRGTNGARQAEGSVRCGSERLLRLTAKWRRHRQNQASKAHDS
jgi:hypothetical protein